MQEEVTLQLKKQLTAGLWSRHSNFGFQLQASKFFGPGSRMTWTIEN